MGPLQSLIATVIVGSLAAGSAAAQVCHGDCNHDRRVTVDELAKGISYALGEEQGPECSAFNQTFHRRVDVADILAAVTNLLQGCGLESLEDLERRRHENLSKWRSSGIDDYEIDYLRVCFCLPPNEVQVVVRQGQVVIVRDARTGDVILNPFPGEPFGFNSIDAVFSIIAQAIEARATTLVVDYHPEVGYPERVWIDYDPAVADEEIGIDITALRPLRAD
jgi:hypothetical protein